MISTNCVGPLEGVRAVELGGIGPAPFAGMLLADLGAQVVRIVRPGAEHSAARLYDRGKSTVVADLKNAVQRDLVHTLIAQADAVFEGFRPGVAERLGLGPEQCRRDHPRLVYGRMTGWGPDGPLRDAPGHDINYLALSGVLAAIGPGGGGPVPPLTLVGDFGGGGALLAVGLCSALLFAQRTGAGQVVEHSVLDGAALLSTVYHGLIADAAWSDERGANLLDSGAPFYRAYETADRRWLAVGALEPEFYRAFVAGLGLDPAALPDRADRTTWPELHRIFAARLRQRDRAEWEAVFAGQSACVTPVLSFAEAPAYPHNAARAAYVDVGGVRQPAPTPRFSATPTAVRSPAGAPAIDMDEAVRCWSVPIAACD